MECFKKVKFRYRNGFRGSSQLSCFTLCSKRLNVEKKYALITDTAYKQQLVKFFSAIEALNEI